MKTYLSVLLAVSLAGCSEKTDVDFRAALVSSIHASLLGDLASLVTAARNLQAAAPNRAWDATTDAAAIHAMRDAWMRARRAYERVEGTLAPLFPELELSIDGRYDEQLAGLAPYGDRNLFDGIGVIGMHAIERILYAPETRPEVLELERALPGYQVAVYPEIDDEAIAFKTQLAQRLIEDARALHDRWKPTAIDLAVTYHGLVALMSEQREKISLAATGEEESRYANVTMFDLRNNLAGTLEIYDLFREWIRSKPTGEQIDAEIVRSFGTLTSIYDTMAGDALPEAPADWNPDDPTPANLATPFGVLWQTVHESVDPARDGSVVVAMKRVAALLGFPALASP